MPKVSPEHKDAVRRRILDAAVTCLERNGYQDVTTRELLTEAGLSTGTFYNYFPSKEHLYETLAEEALARDVALILAGRADGVPVAQGLLNFVQEYVFSDQTGAIAMSSLRARMHAGPEAAEAVTRLNQYVVEALTPLVRNSIEEGFLRADIDPEALVELVDVLWDGMGRRAAQDAFQTSYARVARALMQIVLDGAVSPHHRRDFPNA